MIPVHGDTLTPHPLRGARGGLGSPGVCRTPCLGSEWGWADAMPFGCQEQIPGIWEISEQLSKPRTDFFVLSLDHSEGSEARFILYSFLFLVGHPGVRVGVGIG